MKFETQAEAKKAALKEIRMAKKNIKEIYDNIPKGTIMDVIWHDTLDLRMNLL